jgi:hypothetical protein
METENIKIKYEILLAAYQELEHRKEKNRIANRKYKKSKKGKLSQKKAQHKYNSRTQNGVMV